MTFLRPIRAYYLITSRCNLKCRHCSAIALAIGDELALEESLKLVSALADWGVFLLNLQGGEPLIHPGFFRIAHEAVRRGLRVSVSTNGIMLDRDAARQLCDIGVTCVQVSLDGPPEVHDYIRASVGAFRKAEVALESLLRAGVPASTMMILAQPTAGHISWAVEYATKMGLRGCAFERMIPLNSARTANLQPLDPTGFAQALWEIEQHRREALPNFWVDCGDPLLAVVDLKADTKGESHRGGCSAGVMCTVIGADGTVYPCSHLPVALGNIREHSIQKIWRDSELLRAIRERRSLGGRCGSCAYKAVCGGCRAAAFALTNDPMAADPFCLGSEYIRAAGAKA